MALVLILQLLTFWPLCHTDITTTVPTASYPKPWLGAQPAAIVTPGVNVTLRCRAPQPAWKFALFKYGEITPMLFRVVSTDLAEVFLEEVTPAQGGSYQCSYQNPGWVLGVWSHRSDALELLVTDELPRPSLVALPGPVVAPGDNVSLRCTGRLRDMRFALYRVGEAVPLQYHNSERPWADFPLPRASAPGTYSCYYHTPNAPYVLSQRSEPLVISWDGEGPLPSSTSSLRSGSQGPPLPSTHLNFEGSGSWDYTLGNLIRLGLAGLVLVSLTTLLVLDWRSRPRRLDLDTCCVRRLLRRREAAGSVGWPGPSSGPTALPSC